VPEGTVNKSIIINADAYETRIAILDDHELVELLVERADQRRTSATSTRAASTPCCPACRRRSSTSGLPKTGFLHASDLTASLGDLEDISTSRRTATAGAAPRPKVEDCLKKGQEILVQITKESIGTKGPRVTQQVSLPGGSAC
jgi:ribonuclease G